MTTEIKQRLMNKLCDVLVQRVEPLFKPGTKFAIIARTPGNDEADVIVSDDSIEGLMALLERSKSRKGVR